MDETGALCFQTREASNREASCWDDLVDLEIVPVHDIVPGPRDGSPAGFGNTLVMYMSKFSLLV
jgi:hypothetical protein